MSVKNYLLVMEQEIRRMEHDMKHKVGEALENDGFSIEGFCDILTG